MSDRAVVSPMSLRAQPSSADVHGVQGTICILAILILFLQPASVVDTACMPRPPIGRRLIRGAGGLY